MLRVGALGRAALRGGFARRMSTKLADWATIDPAKWNGANPYHVENLGAWPWRGGERTRAAQRAGRPNCHKRAWIRAFNAGGVAKLETPARAANGQRRADPMLTLPSTTVPTCKHLAPPAVAGAWTKAAQHEVVVDPMNGEPFLHVPDTALGELAPFVESLNACPKTGLHNPLRDVDRYRMLGDVSFKAAAALRDPAVFDFFAKLVQRTSPKSDAQAAAEVRITRQFLDNFTGDNVRFLARGFSVPGDHNGQQSNGYRFPFGPVSIITPFNFPIEIPALQVRAARWEGGGVRPRGRCRSSAAPTLQHALPVHLYPPFPLLCTRR